MIGAASRIRIPRQILYRHTIPRTASTLVVVEHDNKSLSPTSLSAITAAGKLVGDLACLVIGNNAQSVAEQVMLDQSRRSADSCSCDGGREQGGKFNFTIKYGSA